MCDPTFSECINADTSLDISAKSGVGGSFRRRRLLHSMPMHREAIPQLMSMVESSTIPNPPAPKTKKIVKKVKQDISAVPSSNIGMEEQKPIPGHDTNNMKQLHASTTMATTSGEQVDFTLIPKVLDTKLEQYDTDHSLHSIIIKAGSNWTRTRQMNFLTNAATTHLTFDEIRNEKTKAFALLDALSRSGTLPIANSELHVFVAVSHCFENDVMGTVIQENINPIVKVERSSLLLASTIYGKPISTLIEHDHDMRRIAEAFPSLMISDIPTVGRCDEEAATTTTGNEEK